MMGSNLLLLLAALCHIYCSADAGGITSKLQVQVRGMFLRRTEERNPNLFYLSDKRQGVDNCLARMKAPFDDSHVL